MIGYLDIANDALDFLGAENIGSIDEGTRTADLVKRHIDKAVEIALRHGNYNQYTTLSCLPELCLDDTCCTLPPPYTNAFAIPQKPCKFLRAVSVDECCCHCSDIGACCKSETHVPWRRFSVITEHGQKCDAIIACRSGSLNLEYVYMPEDLSGADADISTIIAYSLAIRLAPTLLADNQKVGLLTQQMEQLQARTKAIDAQEIRQEYDYMTSDNYEARSRV